ncbi:hypothetical protein BD309DRAFT_752445 [Dichomitus squalens]|nr:hypothetical protein BD309DRAFT_752445 [Dichomitus squalens]
MHFLIPRTYMCPYVTLGCAVGLVRKLSAPFPNTPCHTSHARSVSYPGFTTLLPGLVSLYPGICVAASVQTRSIHIYPIQHHIDDAGE